jgi:hypothetical protein
MVKKIDLTDTSVEAMDLSISSTDTDNSSIGPILNMLSQIDWKLWEMYKIMKRFEKLFEADKVNLEED